MKTLTQITTAMALIFGMNMSFAASDIYLLNGNDSDPAIDNVGGDGDKLTASNTKKDVFTHAGIKFSIPAHGKTNFSKFEETQSVDDDVYADDDVSIVNVGK